MRIEDFGENVDGENLAFGELQTRNGGKSVITNIYSTNLLSIVRHVVARRQRFVI